MSSMCRTIWGDGHRGEFYKVEDQRFLGSEGFSDRIQRGAREKVEQIYDLSLGDIVGGVEMRFGMPASVISDKGHEPESEGSFGTQYCGIPGPKACGLPFE